MQFSDLDSNEILALVAALRFAVFADGTVTDQEVKALDRVATALGDGAYRAAFDRAASEVTDLASFDRAMASVARKEAQELIYEAVLRTADSDGVTDVEERILSRLARAWNIDIKVEPISGE